MNDTATLRFYRLTADFVFLVHFALVVIVALGWLFPALFYIHLILIILTVFSEIFLGYCLLTRMEFGLRKKIDPTLSFDRSCIVHYLRKWRGLAPRPASTAKMSFFKKTAFFLSSSLSAS